MRLRDGRDLHNLASGSVCVCQGLDDLVEVLDRYDRVADILELRRSRDGRKNIFVKVVNEVRTIAAGEDNVRLTVGSVGSNS